MGPGQVNDVSVGRLQFVWNLSLQMVPLPWQSQRVVAQTSFPPSTVVKAWDSWAKHPCPSRCTVHSGHTSNSRGRTCHRQRHFLLWCTHTSRAVVVTQVDGDAHSNRSGSWSQWHPSRSRTLDLWCQSYSSCQTKTRRPIKRKSNVLLALAQ